MIGDSAPQAQDGRVILIITIRKGGKTMRKEEKTEMQVVSSRNMYRQIPGTSIDEF